MSRKLARRLAVVIVIAMALGGTVLAQLAEAKYIW
jgi:hypothetical protein